MNNETHQETPNSPIDKSPEAIKRTVDQASNLLDRANSGSYVATSELEEVLTAMNAYIEDTSIPSSMVARVITLQPGVQKLFNSAVADREAYKKNLNNLDQDNPWNQTGASNGSRR